MTTIDQISKKINKELYKVWKLSDYTKDSIVMQNEIITVSIQKFVAVNIPCGFISMINHPNDPHFCILYYARLLQSIPDRKTVVYQIEIVTNASAIKHLWP